MSLPKKDSKNSSLSDMIGNLFGGESKRFRIRFSTAFPAACRPRGAAMSTLDMIKLDAFIVGSRSTVVDEVDEDNQNDFYGE